jgi:hypothetical protein
MEDTITDETRAKRLSRTGGIVAAGTVAVVFAAILTARMIWEETALTLHQGPQMLGFSLAHGPGIFLLLAPIVLVVWLIAAVIRIIFTLARKRPLSGAFWGVFAAGGLMLGLIALPPVFWQWMFISQFAQSPHAADLMTDDAAEGDARTVRAYLAHGVPLEAVNYEGSTAAYMAAIGNSVSVLQLLQSKGANLGAVNAYGDSPLQAAVANHRNAAAAFLRSHGAIQIEGSPEQRDSASEAIVKKELERESKLR